MQRHTQILWKIVVVVAVIAILVFLQFREVGGWISRIALVTPRFITEPVASVSRYVHDFGTGVVSIRKLYVENAELKNRVRVLEQALAKSSGFESENETLRATLGFVARPPTGLVPCTVLGRDPDGVTQALVLSCGTDGGVKVGQGVVAGGYLIGKVVLTRQNTSIALLLTASTTFVDARVASKRVSGVLKGSYGSGLQLDFISPTAKVANGDLVTTAGINGDIPPDVLIGSVSDVFHETGVLFDKISVSSPVDFRDIRFVHVLKP